MLGPSTRSRIPSESGTTSQLEITPRSTHIESKGTTYKHHRTTTRIMPYTSAISPRRLCSLAGFIVLLVVIVVVVVPPGALSYAYAGADGGAPPRIPSPLSHSQRSGSSPAVDAAVGIGEGGRALPLPRPNGLLTRIWGSSSPSAADGNDGGESISESGQSRAAGGGGGDDKGWIAKIFVWRNKKFGGITKSNYKFGDITKSAVSTTTVKFEGAVRSATGKEDYKFGDITKSAVSVVKSTTTVKFESAVQSLTGNEDYQFGDLTKGTVGAAGNILTYSERTLGLMREANIHEAVELLRYFWDMNMNDNERREAFIVMIYLGANFVLSYNFISNLMGGMVAATAWTRVATALGKSPLSSGAGWDDFLRSKAGLDMIFGGPCLPLRVAATVPWFFYYRKLVVRLTSLSPLRDEYPNINRIASLLVSWVVGNMAFVGAVTYAMISLGSRMNGVPIFPN